MSLDITLKRQRWISYDEGKTLTEENEHLFDTNITHNLNTMAGEAGIYEAIWRPHRLVEGYNISEKDYDAEYEFEKSVVIKAKDIIEKIEIGLADLKARPNYFRQFDSDNGWGVYDDFVPFVENYLNALKEFPDAVVETDR